MFQQVSLRLIAGSIALIGSQIQSLVRLLICGSPSHPDLGQTSYVLPAVLGKLDHLPVFSIAVARLFSDGKPEVI